MTTPILSIPEVAQSQSNKEVTINNAIRALENSSNQPVSVAVTGTTNISASVAANNLIFQFTGSAGAQTVNFPAKPRFLFIENNTNGILTVQVTGGAGVSVAVPAGEASFVYCDGADFALMTTSAPTAADISYTPTSPLTATTVQAALDEIAVSGGGGSGGGGNAEPWLLHGTYDVGVSGAAANIDFTGINAEEIAIVTVGMTKSAADFARVRVSVNNGSSYYSTLGEYVSLDSAGVETNTTSYGLSGTSSATAQSGFLHILATNRDDCPKPGQSNQSPNGYIFKASDDPINAVRLTIDGVKTWTAGVVYCLIKPTPTAIVTTSPYWPPEAPPAQPIAGDFTLIKDGSTTGSITTTSRGAVLSILGAGAVDNNGLAEVNAPGSTWTMTALLVGNNVPRRFIAEGLYVRDSGTGRIQAFSFGVQGVSPAGRRFRELRWSAIDTFSAATDGIFFTYCGPIWMRLECGASNLTFSISFDGENFELHAVVAKASYVASIDKIGVFLGVNQTDGVQNIDQTLHILSFEAA